ncbi:hypothetical protein [Halogranum amylolyticum]|uniref:hypothetical protein n=1 Tax=Halogranum amylolyticum TaxID=660520 RepID=UPI001114A168|nr:hypothetical protein [Halogranum amylolyticum]
MMTTKTNYLDLNWTFDRTTSIYSVYKGLVSGICGQMLPLGWTIVVRKLTELSAFVRCATAPTTAPSWGVTSERGGGDGAVPVDADADVGVDAVRRRDVRSA